MPKYTATRDYRSEHNGRVFAYDEGSEFEVEADLAEWVNRDSPGTLEPADAEPEVCAGTTAAGEPCSNRAGDDGFCRFHSEDG